MGHGANVRVRSLSGGAHISRVVLRLGKRPRMCGHLEVDQQVGGEEGD